MKRQLWFICASTRFVGIKAFLKGVIPAYRKWKSLMKKNDLRGLGH